jgi:hypothetical protein
MSCEWYDEEEFAAAVEALADSEEVESEEEDEEEPVVNELDTEDESDNE